MLCPKCGQSEMWDNTAPGAKKNPKSPDYKCKDQTCGHAIWQDKGSVKSAPRVEKKGVDCKAMIMAYAKDLVVAELSAGIFSQIVGQCSVDVVKKYFKELWEEYSK